MDKKLFDQEFEDAIKRVLGGTLHGASDIANAALTLLVERSLDLGINPMVTQVVMLRLMETNIEHQRHELKFPKSLQKLTPELIAQTKCDNPFDLFIYFINKMFENESFKKIDIR